MAPNKYYDDIQTSKSDPKTATNAQPATAPEMPKLIDNITTRVKDDLEKTITKKSKICIAAACFSIYAYAELKKIYPALQSYNLFLPPLPLPQIK